MKKHTILLAEDNPSHRELLELALLEACPDLEICTAGSREEIIAIAEPGRFDCAVIDFNLPPFAAPEIIRDLQRIQPDTPIVVVSSSENQSVVIESLRTGVSDFVPKANAVAGTLLWERVRDAIVAERTQQRERRTINRRIQSLRELSETDPLTGLSNRRACDRIIREFAGRPDRRERMATVMIDLDHFKAINDTQGHAAGDDALRSVANIVREEIRSCDIAARWGGEEILVLRQSESITDAWIWADNLRRRIASEVRAGALNSPVTASMGIEVSPVEGLSAESVSRADSAMYLAKETGRDRVCTWPMVRAVEIAYEVGSEVMMTPRARLLHLLERLTPEMGRVQKDHTGPHGRDVRNLALGVAESLSLDPRSVAALELASEFHDIGKLGIPEELLALPRRLTLDERRLIDEHARLGAVILRACGAGELDASVVEMHHRRCDEAEGSGDAEQLASVICACDAFAAMTTERPYCEPIAAERAVAELEACSGSHFRADVVAALKPRAMVHRPAA